MQVLVVGATSALRPAVEQLAGRGHVVHALSRHPEPTRENVVPIAVDHTDVPALRAALDRAPRFDAGLVYAPTAPDAARELFVAAVHGTLVELRTSAHADPLLNPDGSAAAAGSVGVPLLLGWTPDGHWHTAQQLSDAALAVLDDPTPSTLGVVRPWSNRPGGTT